MYLSNFEEIFVISTAVIASILVILGFFIIKWNKKKVQLDVILEYYKEAADEKLIESQKNILHKTNENKNYKMEECKDESMVCNFFEKWGFMVKANYLPFYIFKGSSRSEVMKQYEALVEYIECRQKDNPKYCNEFVYLYYRIKNNKFIE